jgi:nucleoid-associated protein YgaU
MPVKAVPPASSPAPTNVPAPTHSPAPTLRAATGHGTAPTDIPAPTLGSTSSHSPGATHSLAPTSGAAAAHSETGARSARPGKIAKAPPQARTRGGRTNLLYVVQPHDTLWGLAANHLGNADRWEQLFDLNRGRSEPNGNVVDPSLIRVGWTLKFPVGATGLSSEPAPNRVADPVYVVQPGDSLWALAAAHLGSPYRWSELFELNRGRAEPGGRLVDPNLIYVGWTLKFPPGATGLATNSASAHTVESRALENRPTSAGKTVLAVWSGLAQLGQQTNDVIAGWSI